MKIFQKIISFVFLVIICFSFANFSLAEDKKPIDAAAGANSGNPAAPASTPGPSFPNPLGKITTPQQLIGQVIDAILGIVGSLSLLMFVYGGFRLMLAKGDSKEVTEGKNIIVYASIGLIVIFLSYAAVQFVFKALVP